MLDSSSISAHAQKAVDDQHADSEQAKEEFSVPLWYFPFSPSLHVHGKSDADSDGFYFTPTHAVTLCNLTSHAHILVIRFFRKLFHLCFCGRISTLVPLVNERHGFAGLIYWAREIESQ